MAAEDGDISEVIKKRLQDFKAEVVTADVGKVITVGDGIAQVYGLEGAMAGELLEFPGDLFGLALNLEESRVRVVLMGPYEHIQEGDEVRTTGRIVEVPIGPKLIGRVVNPLGEPIDGKGAIEGSETSPVEKIAPGVIARQAVSEPVQTGIKAIDAMIPIGRGQRELILGDRQTGKTAVLLDTIINQKGKDLFCIYVAIGQNAASIARVQATLEEHGAMEYTCIVAATASDPAALIYIAPYTGCAIGEYFRDRGQHALCCYDDLTKHAWAYRELSLNLRRPPGREAYPGDVFYLHSRLLERAAKMSAAQGGGSLSALPVIETQANDISAYIPTNVISITDGQIYMETGLFNAGVRPAINVGLSVSRVGGDAQITPIKRVAGQLKSELAQFRELAAFAQFASDLDKATRDQLERGQRLTELLKQDQYEPVEVGLQVAIIFAGTRGYLDRVPLNRIREWVEGFSRFVRADHKDYMTSIEKDKKWDDSVTERTQKMVEDFNRQFGVEPSKAGSEPGGKKETEGKKESEGEKEAGPEPSGKTEPEGKKEAGSEPSGTKEPEGEKGPGSEPSGTKGPEGKKEPGDEAAPPRSNGGS